LCETASGREAGPISIYRPELGNQEGNRMGFDVTAEDLG
jgi:hypothetical protein